MNYFLGKFASFVRKCFTYNEALASSPASTWAIDVCNRVKPHRSR